MSVPPESNLVHERIVMDERGARAIVAEANTGNSVILKIALRPNIYAAEIMAELNVLTTTQLNEMVSRVDNAAAQVADDSCRKDQLSLGSTLLHELLAQRAERGLIATESRDIAAVIRKAALPEKPPVEGGPNLLREKKRSDVVYSL